MGSLVRIGGHRNIVSVMGFVDDAEQPLLLLEYCAFGSLKGMLVELDRRTLGDPKGPPPATMLSTFAYGVTLAMDFMARHKLVRAHRLGSEVRGVTVRFGSRDTNSH